MIQIINISKIYKKSNGAGIKNISFDFSKKDIIALVGNNGAGKTTAIKSIFGELKIDSGEVKLEGENLFSHYNLRKIAFFPDSNNIVLNMPIKDYLFYGAYIKGLDNKEILNKIDEILAILKIEDLKNKKIKSISAGQKKRVLLASVLIQKPEYIFFDEPTANLDVQGKHEFLSLIQDVHKFNIGILITSHILDELQAIANKLVIIKDGQILYNKNLITKKKI